MQRRNSTNPRRLDRRKSAASVKSVHLECIPPETAERHAQAAAAQAFTRARERSATDASSTLWPPPRPKGHSRSTTGCSPNSKVPSDESRLRREQSIRFVPPRTPKLASSGTTADDTSDSRLAQPSKRYTTDVKNDPRPPIRASGSGMVSAAKGIAGDYIDTLFTSNDYYTPEDDIASMPSSYRRLRKSKSMFTNRTNTTAPKRSELNKSSASANQLPSPADSRAMPLQVDENAPPTLELKALNSMNNLRDFRSSFGSGSRYDNNTTFLPSPSGPIDNQDRTRNGLRPKPSRFFRSKISSQDRTFKKSMREVSSSSVSSNGKIVRGGSLRNKARKVSQGFKHKLKNLFGMVKGDGDDAIFPPQHIEAPRPHILGLESIHYDTENELHRVALADQVELSFVASGIPSLHTVPSYQQLRSRQGSLESLRSEQNASDERSRVTSWSDSDTNTVVTLNSCRDEGERKRLSVIKENGTHVCSSSTRFMTLSEQSNASTASLPQPAQTYHMAVDGQRIYSALMKRMGQPQEAQTSDLGRRSSVDDFVQLGIVPRRKSSLHLRSLGCDTSNSTIRYVMPESESESESTKVNDRPHEQNQNGLLPGSSSRPPLPPTIGPNKDRPNSPVSVPMNSNTRGDSHKDSDEQFLLRPTKEEGPALARTLSSRSSAFFGSPTCHVFRSKSPYRRALKEKMHTATKERPIGSSDCDPWMCSLSSLPIRPLSTCGSDPDIKMTYTESIYSTNTEEDTNRRRSAPSVVEDSPRPSSTHGDVMIFVKPLDYNKRSLSLPAEKRVSSTSSSVEWKTWLSSNVSKLEESTTHVNCTDFQYGLSSARSSGHVRENAQINDDEDQIPDACHTKEHGLLNLNRDIGDNQPTSFDAGEKFNTIRQSRGPYTNPFPTSISTLSVVSAGEQLKTSTQKNVTKGQSSTDREKPLPKVPSLNSSKNRLNITMKLVKRKPKITNNMVPLASLSDSGEKAANSQRQMDDMASAKTENVSPFALHNNNDDNVDPYEVDGAGVLGPHQQTLGSNRMVDIFLSSRRRRMASTDEGSVFL